MKKGIMVFCILFALLPVLAAPAAAASEGNGTVRVTLRSGSIYASSGTLTLYMVGDEISGGYRLKESFGGGVISVKDTQMEELPHWLAEQAEGGTTLEIDVAGTVEFSGLKEGLYLVVQREASDGFYPVEPFLVRLPWMEEQWYLEARPKLEQYPQETPQTGQSLMPVLSAVMMLLSGSGLVLCWQWKKRMGFEDLL